MNQEKQILLFGISYAGASAIAVYSPWNRFLPESIKMVPLDLAGHGKRINEAFAPNVASVVRDLIDTIKAAISDDQPYSIYGHSIGSTLSYELVKGLTVEGCHEPLALFLSGRNPPHHPYRNCYLHLMDDERFLQEIRKLGGTPDEFFKMKDLVATFLPIMRNDYRIIEQYEFEYPIFRSKADICFFKSNNDPLLSTDAVHEWKEYTRGSFKVKHYSGGHFFINDERQAICDAIASELSLYLSGFAC
jgi:medium-chain acyl-[acyl-carrier-protein] hydrolase